MTQKLYCNVLAREKNFDPIGHAGWFDTAFALELPLPWPYAIITEPDCLPPELVQLIIAHFELPEAERPHVLPMFIAPDDKYSKPGYRRFIQYTRPSSGSFAKYNAVEYHLPEDMVGKAIWALERDPNSLSQFTEYRVDTDGMRDLMVCTHGTVDVACAKFGYPLYKHLRENVADEQTRVWRVSHFGGHIFAPTVMDLPTGHYWAYVEEDQANHIAKRSSDVDDLSMHYRGWAGLDSGFLQAAEREMWQAYGWQWFDFAKSGEIIDQEHQHEHDDVRRNLHHHDHGQHSTWAQVRLNYQTAPDAAIESVEMRVEIASYLTAIHTTDVTQTYDYPQYKVTEIRR